MLLTMYDLFSFLPIQIDKVFCLTDQYFSIASFQPPPPKLHLTHQDLSININKS